MQASRATDLVTQTRRGFTIVELMVSITILSLLVVMLAGVFGQVSRAWTSGEAGIERRRNVRALADFIGAELRGAMIPLEGASYDAAGNAQDGNLQFVVNPPVSAVPDEYRNADAVFWQAPLATETSFGEVAEIGYFVKWDEADRANPRPRLCRFFVNPSKAEGDTFVRNPAFLIYERQKPWLSKSLLDEIAPGNNERGTGGQRNGYRGLFAENVLGLWVECFGLDGTDRYEITGKRSFDSRSGYDCTFKAFKTDGTPQTWVERRFLPGSVRVSLAQVDSKSAARITPVWERIRELTRAGDVRNAADFQRVFREEAGHNPRAAAVLPGMRIYSIEVGLQNAQ